ncbi:beta-propeller domain-containing protein [Nocardioidaceae bacterium]|nr:beta-propeller domain-containing protein [Nocardioidaceae bacterium]
MARRFSTRTRVGVTAAGVVGLAGALALGVVPDGVPTGGVGKPAPAAAAPGLVAFDSCEALRQYYVEQALPEVTAYGLGGGPVYALDAVAQSSVGGSVARDAAAVSDAVGSGETGTNVQEAGVDEPDVAKTDAAYVYQVVEQALVVTDVTGDAPEQVARFALPRGVSGAELLLVDDTVHVITQGGSDYPIASLGRSVVADSLMIGPVGDARTRVVTIDVSDRSAPQVTSDTQYDGSLVSARQYDDVVRLVTSDSSPDIDFVSPVMRTRSGDGPERLTAAEARRENRRLVREAPLEAWLPSVGDGEQLTDCDEVLRPADGSGYGTLSVIGLDGTASDPAASRSATALVASGDLAYSSTDQLVVATSRWGWTWGVELRREGADAAEGPETSLHVFDLDGLDAVWRASGSFEGGLKDRWSIDAHDDRIRVAAGIGYDSWMPEENAVISFAPEGDRLVETGRADGLGIGEEIKSVRWFDDLAIVVTFVQTDPLYTVDVSTGQPETLGELKIPGFSSYLHPIGEDRLLGLGTATRVVGQGERAFVRATAAKASVFDVSDLGSPTELDFTTLQRNTSFNPDPRAFTWLPDSSTGFVVSDEYGSRRPTAYVTRIDVDDAGSVTLSEAAQLRPYDSYAARTLPLGDGRVALVTLDGVRLLGLSG